MRIKLRTYHYEEAVVLAILLIPFIFSDHIRLTEVIAVAAVFFTFKHAVIADRMQERQALRETPEVECWRKSNQFFITKEILWILFFSMTHAWAALLGAVVFFCYPFWRKWYRKHYPIDRPQ